ncbi:ATPase AAA [Spirochaetia bacterium]|nr:ATPase AAA [Spirochaetia bacterium]
MIIGRERELGHLKERYDRGGFQFIVMYGRRRVGKTTIISEFIKDKPAIFFAAQEYDDTTALKLFSERVFDHFGIGDLPPFDTWNRAFEFIAREGASERLVLALDEFPYLAAANKSIPSILQNIIDHLYRKTELFLIICGSSMSFMERGVLSEKSPLYGRLSSQMEVLPFGYRDSARFFPRYSLEDKLAAYGIMGGIPQYLIHIDDVRSLRDNIVTGILSRPSALYEEPRNLLKEELRRPQVYNAIIEAIAKGQTRLNDIVTKTGIPRDKCLKYIRSLLELHILTRETPIGEETGKRSIYKLMDNFFKFWYAFVFENTELVEQGNGGLLYDRMVTPFLSEFTGSEVFENVCKEYLRKLNGSKRGSVQLPFLFTHIGRWWGSSPKTKTEIEIDILAYNRKEALFCECKWTNRMMGNDILETLKEKASRFPQFTSQFYVLFSKSGFTASLKRAAAEEGNVLLVDLKMLYA